MGCDDSAGGLLEYVPAMERAAAAPRGKRPEEMGLAAGGNHEGYRGVGAVRKEARGGVE